jgi:F0F1-type ATP synthase assembly protein I
MDKKDERGETLRQLGPLLGVGTMLAASLTLGVLAGYWLDGKLGTRPWLTLVGLFLGLGLGVYNLVVVILARPRE